MYTSCLRCNRPLKNHESMERGYGPVCFGKVPHSSKDEDLQEEDNLFLTEERYEEILNTEPITLQGNWQSRGVQLNGLHLDPGYSQAVYNHSPDGFNWGYGGSGPAQLALAIMLEIVKNRNAATSLYQEFKWDFIAGLPQSDFNVSIDVATWLREHRERLSIEKAS